MVSHAVARAMDPNYTADQSSYGWVVTYDHLDHKRVKIYGPHNITNEQQSKLSSGSGQKFKMYDDDGELYYSGQYIGPDDEFMFSPLDDYGTPNAGATEIRYLNSETGKYETL